MSDVFFCLESLGCHWIPLSCLLPRFSVQPSCSFCLVVFLYSPLALSVLSFFCIALLLFLSCHFSVQPSCSFCLVIYLLTVHSCDFFIFQKIFSIVFIKRYSFFFGVRGWVGMVLVVQLGDDSWQVVCAACCHMALVFYGSGILHYAFLFFIVSVYSFFVLYYFSCGIYTLDEMVDNTSMSQSFMHFSKANIEGTNSSKKFGLTFLFMFCFVEVLILWISVENGLHI